MASDHWGIITMTSDRGIAQGLRNHFETQGVPIRLMLDDRVPDEPTYVVQVPDEARRFAEKVLCYFNPFAFMEDSGDGDIDIKTLKH